MHAIINADYPFRVQLVVDSPQIGPFATSGGAAFNPTTDVDVYVNGIPTEVISYSWDAVNNRYLLNIAGAVDANSTVQVIHHAPSSPFQSSTGIVPTPTTSSITGTT